MGSSFVVQGLVKEFRKLGVFLVQFRAGRKIKTALEKFGTKTPTYALTVTHPPFIRFDFTSRGIFIWVRTVCPQPFCLLPFLSGFFFLPPIFFRVWFFFFSIVRPGGAYTLLFVRIWLMCRRERERESRAKRCVAFCGCKFLPTPSGRAGNASWWFFMRRGCASLATMRNEFSHCETASNPGDWRFGEHAPDFELGVIFILIEEFFFRLFSYSRQWVYCNYRFKIHRDEVLCAKRIRAIVSGRWNFTYIFIVSRVQSPRCRPLISDFQKIKLGFSKK